MEEPTLEEPQVALTLSQAMIMMLRLMSTVCLCTPPIIEFIDPGKTWKCSDHVCIFRLHKATKVGAFEGVACIH